MIVKLISSHFIILKTIVNERESCHVVGTCFREDPPTFELLHGLMPITCRVSEFFERLRFESVSIGYLIAISTSHIVLYHPHCTESAIELLCFLKGHKNRHVSKSSGIG